MTRKQVFESVKRRPLKVCFFLVSLLHFSEASFAGDTADQLPTIGDRTSGIIGLKQEKQLGDNWLKSLRRQIKTYDDPLLNNYFTDLVYRLVPVSKLQDRQLKTVVVDSKELNAFAVPGGIVGINAGLFLYAETEQQFASVIAHELAHLSQRHYARSVEYMRETAPLQMAGLLASILLAATVSSDAGMAAMVGTQALGAQNQLAYSRKNEQEADRIGQQTLHQAGMDPEAMSQMFEQMLKSRRYSGESIPEYLSTHPLTESRVADTRERARRFPSRHYQEDLDYYLMQARVLLRYSHSLGEARAFFHARSESGSPAEQVQARYGEALALRALKQYTSALELMDTLIKDDPSRLTYVIAKAQILADMGKTDQATALVNKSLKLSPDSYPLLFYAAKIHVLAGDIEKAEDLLIRASQLRKEEPIVWYELAEVHGLTRNITALHQARAEYYFLQGRYKEALEQLELAETKNRNGFPVEAVIEQRIREITEYQSASRF